MADKRCASTTTHPPQDRQQPVVSKQHKPEVRVVNVPSDTYQHHTELESSSANRHTNIRLNRAFLLAASSYLCIVAFDLFVVTCEV